MCLIQSHINADKRSRFAAFIASRRRNEFIFNEFDPSVVSTHTFRNGLFVLLRHTSYIRATLQQALEIAGFLLMTSGNYDSNNFRIPFSDSK